MSLPGSQAGAAAESVDHPSVITQVSPRMRLEFHPESAQHLKTPTPQEVVVKFQSVGGGFLAVKHDGQLAIDNTAHELQCVTFLRRRVRVCDGQPVISLQSEKHPCRWITGHTATNYKVDGKVSYSSLFPDSQIGKHWQVLQYWGNGHEQNLYFTITYDQSSHLQCLLSSSLDEVKNHGAFFIDSPPQ